MVKSVKISIVMLLIIFSMKGKAQQSMSCNQALSQIAQYGNSVINNYNQYVYWIQNSIHPYYQVGYYNSLNYWYAQQAQYVNSIYAQTYYQCTGNNMKQIMQGQRQQRNNTQEQIASNHPNLTDSQGRKRVRLEIPNNPMGWAGN